MSDLVELSTEQRRKEQRSRRRRAVLGTVAGGTTLAAAGMAVAPRVAGLRSVQRFAGKKMAPRLQKLSGNRHKWNERASNTWLTGSVPGAATGLSAANATWRQADQDSKKLRPDGSLKSGVVKSDSWQDHVSPGAREGYEHLRRGQRKNYRAAAGEAALAGLTGGLAVHRGMIARRRPTFEVKGQRKLAAASSGIWGLMALSSAGRARERFQRGNEWGGKAGKIRSAGRDRMAGRRSDGPVVKFEGGEGRLREEWGQVSKVALKKPKATFNTGAVMRPGGTMRTVGGGVAAKRGGWARTSNPAGPPRRGIV